MLEILLNCARADLAWALAEAERTGDVRFQDQAADARAQVETLEIMLKVPA